MTSFNIREIGLRLFKEWGGGGGGGPLAILVGSVLVYIEMSRIVSLPLGRGSRLNLALSSVEPTRSTARLDCVSMPEEEIHNLR